MTLVSELKKDLNSDSGTDQETMQSNIEKARNQVQTKKVDLQTAENTLTMLKSKQQIARLTAQSDLKLAKNKLDDLIDRVQLSDDLQAAKDTLESAQEDLTTTLKQYEDYQIIANFD